MPDHHKTQRELEAEVVEAWQALRDVDHTGGEESLKDAIQVLRDSFGHERAALVGRVQVAEDAARRLARIVLPACRQRGLAGQAFTEYICGFCGEEKMHHNTACPPVCETCQKELAILAKGTSDGNQKQSG